MGSTLAQATVAQAALALAAFALGVGCEGSIASTPGVGGGSSFGGSSSVGGSGAVVGGGGPGVPESGAPTSRFYRLSHSQWETTVRDLLGLGDAPGIASGFSKDAVDAFANNGEALSVADQLRQDYQRAAETLAQQIASDPTSLGRLIPADAPGDSAGRANALIAELGRRAHRRPLDASEQAEYFALFQLALTVDPAADPFTLGAQMVLEAVLQSPFFLYRTELGEPGARLSDHELAAKLSFSLTSSMPDEALFNAAQTSALSTPAGLAAEATRLLESGEGPGRAFHTQLYALDDYAQIQKDPALVPEWNEQMGDSMRTEAQLFLTEVFTSGGTLTDILTAPFTFVDQSLAPLYGVAAPAGDGFVRVELDPAQRAGFLTRLGFLSKFAGSVDPDPIHRGAFINERLLCVELPPPTVTVFPEPPEGLATNRERVDALTGEGTCGAVCHGQWMNPAGFAFEHYDGVGRYRTLDNGQPVNAADSFPFSDGERSFTNAIEFSQAIAQSADSHHCYSEYWLTYLQGRKLRPADLAIVESLATASMNGARVKDLVLQVVTHDIFTHRMP